jgi:hypothetical protein
MISHARLSAAMMRLDPGTSGRVLGVEVRRLPADGKYEPACGRYRVAGGEVQLLLAALDRLAALAGLRAVSGEAPWRDLDGEPSPAPSYHGHCPAPPPTGCDSGGV